MIDLAKRPIRERYEHLIDVIASERFLKMQGLGNEVPFFICPFHPEESFEFDQMLTNLINALTNKGVVVLMLNLYDLSIEILTIRGIWNEIIQTEKTLPKDELKELLQNVLDPEKRLVPAISKKMEAQEFDVMFITGVGEVFPYIRSHTVLNNLQSKAKDKPTVMFFPGEYKQSIEEGASLSLFNHLYDDNYYRAFNIYKHF